MQDMNEDMYYMLVYKLEIDSNDHFLCYNTTLRFLFTDNYLSPRFKLLEKVMESTSKYRKAIKKGSLERKDKLDWLLNCWIAIKSFTKKETVEKESNIFEV
jgi:hypothetical protein